MGRIGGVCTLPGQPASGIKDVHRHIAYVMQDDILMESLTVRHPRCRTMKPPPPTPGETKLSPGDFVLATKPFSLLGVVFSQMLTSEDGRDAGGSSCQKLQSCLSLGATQFDTWQKKEPAQFLFGIFWLFGFFFGFSLGATISAEVSVGEGIYFGTAQNRCRG